MGATLQSSLRGAEGDEAIATGIYLRIEIASALRASQ
jgi:hypothetical protein